ncbi:major facilitator superfamily transporter [Xylariaceae sp. FL0016]|nr:major facilitator superfamily transporter [Xylariaceae sp. FL0016]
MDTPTATVSSQSEIQLKEADEAQVPRQEEWRPNMHQNLIIWTLAVISLIVALDASIVVTPLNAIVTELGGDSTEGFWIGTSYLLVNAVTMPFICSISDIFGRPICLEFGLVAFTVGTIFCCTADNITMLLVGRCIQGVGGAGIHALGLVTMTDIVPLRYRPKYYTIILGGWAIGLTTGPVIGGAIVANVTWRWIFYIMFPFCAFGLVAVPWLLTLKPRESTLREKVMRVDWIGGGIFTSSATSFLVAVSWGGVQYAWSSYQTLVPLLIGVFGFIATVFYERRFAKHPFLRRSLFHNWSSIITYVLAGMHGILLYGYMYYLAFYFLAVKGFTTINAGVALLPVMIAVASASMVTGRLITRFNHYKWAIVIGWGFGSLGSGMALIWGTNNSAPVWVITLLVLGAGQGTVLNAQNFASQAMSKSGDEASAAAMYAFARQFGAALGVGVGGTTFQNVMALKLRWEGLSVDIAKHAESYVGVLRTMPDGDTTRQRIKDAYVFGFLGVYEVYLGLSILALILSMIFIKNYDMNKILVSEHQLDGSQLTKVFEGSSPSRGPSPSASSPVLARTSASEKVSSEAAKQGSNIAGTDKSEGASTQS